MLSSVSREALSLTLNNCRSEGPKSSLMSWNHTWRKPPPPAPILQLPEGLHEKIFSYANSKDRMSLAWTCHRLRLQSHMVYENLHFEIGHGDAEKTARVAISLEKLCELFHYAWRYRRATTSITIYDSCDARVAPSTPPPDYDQYIAHMDLSLRSILHYTTHLTTFVMDASTTGQILHLPNALSILNMVFNLREVALLSVCCGRGQLPHMGGQVQHAIIRNAGPDATWYGSFLDKQRLSRLDISDTTSHDGRWQEAFLAPAASWAGLSCLCISCTDNNLLDYANLIERGLVSTRPVSTCFDV
ncbi:hypothetical protein BKA93DRAFT_390525 [Sparassis latifolia]